MAVAVYAAYFGLCAVMATWSRVAARLRLRPFAAAAPLAALVLAAAPAMVLVSEPAEWLSDFRKAYYAAGREVLRDPTAMYGDDELRFVNLPLLALPFAPLAALPLRPAKWVFTLAGLLAVAAGWLMLARLTGPGPRRRMALAVLFVLSGPLYYSLREGNLTHFLLPVLVGAYLCLQHRRDLGLGALVGMAALVKPPLLLAAGFLVWKQRWRAVAACAALILLTTVASLAWFGPGLHRLWLDRCVGPFASRPLTAYNVQSAASFLARLLTDGPLDQSWEPVAVGSTFGILHLLLLTLLGGVPLLACLRPVGTNATQADQLELGLAICLAVLASPVSWVHYYLLLLVPAALLMDGRLGARRSWAVVAVAALLVTASPVVALSSEAWPVRLLASHRWMGGVVLLGSLAVARWRVAEDGLAPVTHARRPATATGSPHRAAFRPPLEVVARSWSGVERPHPC